MKSRMFNATVFSIVLCLGGAVAAQREYGLPAPEPPEAAAHLAAARAAAGTLWKQAYFYFCDTQRRINTPSDPWLPPMKVFDNLYFIGSAGMATWIIQTSAGLVMFDSGYPQHLEEVLLAGMAELKLNPADVKYIMAGHGAFDHWGGAAYFQKKYGTGVIMDRQNGWSLTKSFNYATYRKAPLLTFVGVPLNNPPPYSVAPTFDPKRDIEFEDKYDLTVGDTTFLITKGIRVIFPVKDGATTHTAGLHGSISLGNSGPNQGLRSNIQNMINWREEAKRHNVDVEIQNHPLFDNLPEKLTALRLRKRGAEHPFVVGVENYGKLFTVMAECSEVHLARRAAGTALPYNTEPTIMPGAAQPGAPQD